MSELKVLEIRTTRKSDSHWDNRGEVAHGRLNMLHKKNNKAAWSLFSDEKDWTLYILNELEYSSFAKPVSEDSRFAIKSEVKAKGVKLSEVLNAQKQKWNFLTLDVRGTGVNVILGGSANIKKNFVGVEVFDFVDNHYEYGKNVSTSAEFLKNAGFTKIVDETFKDSNGFDVKRIVFVNEDTDKKGALNEIKSIMK